MTIVPVTPRSLCRLATTSLIAIAFCASTFFGAEAQTRGIGIGTGMMILNGSTGTCVAAPDRPDGYPGESPNCRLAPTLIEGSTMTSQERKDRRMSGSGPRRWGGPRTPVKPVVKRVGKKKPAQEPRINYGACGGCSKSSDQITK